MILLLQHFDPPLNRGVIAQFKRFGHHRPDRMEVHVSRTSQQRRLVYAPVLRCPLVLAKLEILTPAATLVLVCGDVSRDALSITAYTPPPSSSSSFSKRSCSAS